MKKHFNKIILFLVIGLFFLPSISSYKNQQYQPDDEIDQWQIQCNHHFTTNSNFEVAQSFVPSLGELTRVELYISGESAITVSIRDALDGEDLTSITLSTEFIPRSPDWAAFDFDDIIITPGEKYFIIKLGGGTWGFCDGDQYPVGEPWSSISGWHIFEPNGNTGDWCFKTYGRNLAPSVPIITGVTNGKINERYDYDFVSDDPENDKIYYYIDWGDDTNKEWVGPIDSGEKRTERHSFNSEGGYLIRAKAKDINGLESDWSEPLHVIMPKEKILFSLDKLIQHFPSIFQFLMNKLNVIYHL